MTSLLVLKPSIRIITFDIVMLEYYLILNKKSYLIYAKRSILSYTLIKRKKICFSEWNSVLRNDIFIFAIF